MCTSFVYRKENVVVGMNFDNDGKELRFVPCRGSDFLVSVKTRGVFYPSFGVSSGGVFVNDLMVDSDGSGKYKRQNEKRWLTTSVVRHVIDTGCSIDELKTLLSWVEIVNSPFFSTHNFIAGSDGSCLVIEPGRKNISSSRADSPFAVMTNFPLSDYSELVPLNPTGSGADRFSRVVDSLSIQTGPLSIGRAFEILASVKQDGPEWLTELSLVFDAQSRSLFYCADRHFDNVVKYDFESNKTQFRHH